MSSRSPWDRVRQQQISRRSLLQSGARAGVGAAGLALVGCGSDDDEQQQQEQQAQPAEQTQQQQQQQQATAAQARQTDDEIKRGGALRIGWDLALSGVRGPYAQSQHGAFHTPVWDTLIRYPYDSLEPEARLAESWEFNGDQTVLTVNLRPGLEFHNARPIEAESVKASFEAILHPDTPNSQVKEPLAKYVERIEAVDKTTLNFGHVLDPDEIASLEGYGTVAASGPFKWDPDPHIVDQFARIVRHENFYDPAYLDAITYQTFPDRESMTLALAADEIDLSPAFPPEQFQSFEQNQDFNLVQGVARGLWVFDMVGTSRGGGHPVFDDPRVRRALYRCIDRDYFNVEEAKALMVDAGYADGTPEMELSTWRGALDNAIAQIIINDALQAGFNFKIHLQDRPSWLERFLAGDHESYINTYGFQWLHPQTLPVMNYQMRIPNSCAYDTPEYQAMIDGFATATTESSRPALLNDFNDILDREPWVAPIATASGIWAGHQRLQNLDWAVSGYVPSMEKFWLDN